MHPSTADRQLEESSMYAAARSSHDELRSLYLVRCQTKVKLGTPASITAQKTAEHTIDYAIFNIPPGVHSDDSPVLCFKS